MLYQDEVRISLNEYLKNTGTKVRFVCSKLDIPETTISHFRRGRRELPEHLLIRLKKYLANNNSNI